VANQIDLICVPQLTRAEGRLAAQSLLGGIVRLSSLPLGTAELFASQVGAAFSEPHGQMITGLTAADSDQALDLLLQ
jgi:hypothetical protein